MVNVGLTYPRDVHEDTREWLHAHGWELNAERPIAHRAWELTGAPMELEDLAHATARVTARLFPDGIAPIRVELVD